MESNIPDISVIIPVYNVAPYIKECAESLFNQTLSNIEYIFIDDGSSDNSLQILEETLSHYPHRKEGVKIIKHLTNKGVSATREEGMKIAGGKWMIHCDSDDTLPVDAYEKMLLSAEENDVDIVACGYRLFGDNMADTSISEGDKVISAPFMIESIAGIRKPKIRGFLCNKLIKTDLIRGFNLNYGLSFCEDEVIIFNILLRNPNITIKLLPDALYNYRVRETSLTQKRTARQERDIYKLIEIFENFKDGIGKDFADAWNVKITSLLYLSLLYHPEVKEFSKRFKGYKPYVAQNKSLNFFRRLHLCSVLNNLPLIAEGIEACNRGGLSAIKKLKNVIKGGR